MTVSGHGPRLSAAPRRAGRKTWPRLRRSSMLDSTRGLKSQENPEQESREERDHHRAEVMRSRGLDSANVMGRRRAGFPGERLRQRDGTQEGKTPGASTPPHAAGRRTPPPPGASSPRLSETPRASHAPRTSTGPRSRSCFPGPLVLDDLRRSSMLESNQGRPSQDENPGDETARGDSLGRGRFAFPGPFRLGRLGPSSMLDLYGPDLAETPPRLGERARHRDGGDAPRLGQLGPLWGHLRRADLRRGRPGRDLAGPRRDAIETGTNRLGIYSIITSLYPARLGENVRRRDAETAKREIFDVPRSHSCRRAIPPGPKQVISCDAAACPHAPELSTTYDNSYYVTLRDALQSFVHAITYITHLLGLSLWITMGTTRRACLKILDVLRRRADGLASGEPTSRAPARGGSLPSQMRPVSILKVLHAGQCQGRGPRSKSEKNSGLYLLSPEARGRLAVGPFPGGRS